jgi:hypothetical protein
VGQQHIVGAAAAAHHGPAARWLSWVTGDLSRGSRVQCMAVQDSTVSTNQYSTAQRSTVQCSTMQQLRPWVRHPMPAWSSSSSASSTLATGPAGRACCAARGLGRQGGEETVVVGWSHSRSVGRHGSHNHQHQSLHRAYLHSKLRLHSMTGNTPQNF